ncbi:Elsinochromes biosynthesis cluster protein HP1 [Fulvia fulva]|uniref:Elsinochromes biosynthesis cluster protein HP1 n=1 Tax=Passalora fulva TaxID=5499 RepID=A0A9Q8LGX1_PASFU|nr:Elsinochromes biosynthesis cluster protein HP1 [Fulvia fulva]KAK4624331.1 Elsinochromes biosynthesis cluster protein HP1 [Fulvia fulva]KAK4625252.1 Elsinochromes biosynthesis cluster protein HP1 [Fulvia fulva]UJO17242.1 Elsinochromes biosynthesis cluster protein HP1 [Fulvia fulva]WPV14591.1 Elsinochromes biosynthesis cluster protein HP1 [Fulvia fulva]WPV30518.1 Elsinochromes biosynthesis cluster protein HP1 [Fulvia fulva]
MISKNECFELIVNGTVVKPDADISGPGVLIAFVFSAGATLLATLIAYAFGLVDDGLLRPVDRLVLRAPSRASKHLQLHVALRKAVLALSDQQIVTGIAILGAGFNGLRSGTISVYHFQTVIYLAWMSSSVHLSALTLLRPYLHSHKGVMWWRVAGMLTLLVMLLVALVPTVSNDWMILSNNDAGTYGSTKSALGVPAICYWGETWGVGRNPDSIMSFVVLIVSYIWKMGGLFMPVRSRLETWFRNPCDHVLERLLTAVARKHERHGGVVWRWVFRSGLAIYLPLTAFLETLGSFSAALWLSVLGFIYGGLQILVPRALVQQLDSNVQANEDSFGFGQLMPLILLVQPLGAISEHFGLKKGTEDEALYNDRGTSDRYTAAVASLSSSPHAIGIPEQPFLHFMASYRAAPIKEQTPERMQLKALLYTSTLFHLLIWLTHAGVLGTAIIVFYVDYFTIGYQSAGNWQYIGFGVVAWLAFTPLVTLVLSPFSRLGRRMKCGLHGNANEVQMQAMEACQKDDASSCSPLTGDLEQRTGFGKRWTPPNLQVNTQTGQVDTNSLTITPTRPVNGSKEGEVWASEWRRRSIAQGNSPRSPKTA